MKDEEVADGKSLKNISNPGWEGMFDINDYEDEIKRLNKIIDLLISANIDSRYTQPIFKNFESNKYPALCFGMWNIILNDVTDDTSLKDVKDMFRKRIDSLMDNKE